MKANCLYILELSCVWGSENQAWVYFVKCNKYRCIFSGKTGRNLAIMSCFIAVHTLKTGIASLVSDSLSFHRNIIHHMGNMIWLVGLLYQAVLTGWSVQVNPWQGCRRWVQCHDNAAFLCVQRWKFCSFSSPLLTHVRVWLAASGCVQRAALPYLLTRSGSKTEECFMFLMATAGLLTQIFTFPHNCGVSNTRWLPAALIATELWPVRGWMICLTSPAWIMSGW